MATARTLSERPSVDPDGDPVPPRSNGERLARLLAGAGVVALAVLLIGGAALVFARGGDRETARARDAAASASSTVAPPTTVGSAGGAGPAVAADGATGATPSSVPPTTTGLPDGGAFGPAAEGTPAARMPERLPVQVTVSPTTGLRSGQAITVRVAPDAGSQVFGVEAALCAGGKPIAYDADLRPTQTGTCVLHPLAAGTDARKEIAGTPPYQGLDLTFVVGTGTDSYQRRDGTPVQITCDAANPCQLALKVQVPNGFGFQTYPVTFS